MIERTVLQRVVPNASPEGVPPTKGIMQTSHYGILLKLDILWINFIYAVYV